MAKRQPARRGKGRGRAATSARSKRRTSRRASALAALRERFRSGFGRHAQDVWGVLLLVGGILLGLAAFGLAGPFGSLVDSGLRLLFGVWALVVPVVLVILGVTLILSTPHREQGRLAAGFGVTFVASLALFHLMTGSVSLAASLDLVKERGGAIGSLIAFQRLNASRRHASIHSGSFFFAEMKRTVLSSSPFGALIVSIAVSKPYLY